MEPSSKPNTFCFADKGELKAAVVSYISTCSNNTNCLVGQNHGWPMNSWCVGNVTDMSELFKDMETFNEDISGWDTSSVVSMENMFYNAISFNGNLSSWNTSSVASMAMMFSGATSFNSDLSSWDISSVTSMNWMFEGATSFNGNISAWDTSSVTTINKTFAVIPKTTDASTYGAFFVVVSCPSS